MTESERIAYRITRRRLRRAERCEERLTQLRYHTGLQLRSEAPWHVQEVARLRRRVADLGSRLALVSIVAHWQRVALGWPT